MRIGIFTDMYTPYISGVVTSIRILKKSLEEMGNEVYVVTINKDELKYSYDEKEKVLRIPGIKIGIYDDAKVSGIYPMRAINRIKKWKLDVIHSHTEFSMGTFARIIGKQFNIPIVHTYHTMYEDYAYLVTKGYFDKPVKKILEYLTLFYCDKTVSELIVPTKKAYDLFKIKYKSDRNIHIIPTGTDTKKFNRKNFKDEQVLELKEKIGIDKKDFVILVLGRLSKEKDVDFLIDSHKLLTKKNKNIKLLIVGDGPYTEKLKKRAVKTKNSNDIIFIGKVPWEEIALYYQLGDIFATASKTETQGLTVNEALASSLPVLCVDDDSFKLSVIDGFNGFFFKNKKEYKEKVELLISNKSLYETMSIQAVNSSIKFSIKHFGESILSVYKMAMEKNKKDIFQKIKDFVNFRR